MAKLWLEWNSTTTQRARNKANGDIKDVKTCRIFAINTRKRGTIRGEIGETVVGVELNNNTGSTKPEHNEQGRKIHRLEMSVHNGHVRVITWRVAA